MRLTIEQLSRYSYELDACADAAERQVTERLAARWQEVRDLGLEDAVPAMREEATVALVRAEDTFGVSSAAIGHNMLADVVAGEGVPPRGIDGMVVADEYADSQSARYWAGMLDGTDEGFERFLSGIATRARRNVSHAADREVALSSARMGRTHKGIRFARVPSGPSCGFCIMLASRGFVYATRQSAGEFTKFHDNCDCRVIAGIAGMEVEGYDPDRLYERYAKCVEAINGGTLNSSNGQIYEDWERLSEEEQAEWGKKTKNNKDAFNNYFEHRVCQEMNTRDREWVYTGKSTPIDYSSCARSSYGNLLKKSVEFNPSDYDEQNITDKGIEWRDLFVHDALSNAGIPYATRPQAAIGPDGTVIDGVTTPDGRIGTVIWEIKSVRDGLVPHKPKNDLKFIEQAFRDARQNFANPYDEIHMSGMGDMRSNARLILNTRYRTIMSSYKEVCAEIRRRVTHYGIECLWIDRYGNVSRFVK